MHSFRKKLQADQNRKKAGDFLVAIIRDELTLVDRFTAVWDRFINYGEKAVAQADQVEAANNRVAASFSSSSEIASQNASVYMSVYESMLAAGRSQADAMEAATNAAREQFYTVNELGEAHSETQNKVNELSSALLESANAVSQEANAILGNLDTIEDFTNALGRTEREIAKKNEQLQEAAAKYEQLAQSQSASTDQMDKQRYRVEELTASLQKLTRQHEELNTELNELEKAGGSDILDGIGVAAGNATTQVIALVAKIGALITGLFSVKAIIDLIQDSIGEASLSYRFEAIFGTQYGEAATDWIRDQAREFGRTTEQIAKATQAFTRATTNVSSLERLNNIAERLSRFSINGDFDSTANSINMALRTGWLRSLSTQSGISTGLLSQFGVDTAAKAGDVEGFITALERAADAAGLTQEAYERLLQSPENQVERFVNTIQNGVRRAVASFYEYFGPAFEQLNAWLESPEAHRYLSLLAIAFETVGQAALWLVEQVVKLANIISGNLETAAFIAAAGVLVLAAAFTVLVISALPFLTIVAILIGTAIGLANAFLDAADDTEDAFGRVGRAVGAAFFIVGNIIIDTWNLMIGFAEAFANIFDDPAASAARVIYELFSYVINLASIAGAALDAIFDTNKFSAEIGALQNRLDSWVGGFGEPSVQFERIERLDLDETLDRFQGIGEDIGRKIGNLDDYLPKEFEYEDFSDLLGSDNLVPVNVKKNSDKVSLADEDLRLLVDLAERRYVLNVNLETAAPNINVTAKNEIGTPLTSQDIADSVKNILVEEMANHSYASYAYSQN